RPLPETIRLTPPPLENGKRIIKIAFYNILTTFVTDQSSKKLCFPQYQWENRREKPALQLIYEDSPHVLGLCELDLRQVLSIQKELKTGGKLERYKLVGFASETGQSIEATAQAFQIDEQRKYGEIVGLLFDTKRIILKNILCHILPYERGQKW